MIGIRGGYLKLGRFTRKRFSYGVRLKEQVVSAQETVDELGLKFETLAEQGRSGPPPKAGPTGGYDTARKT